MSEIIKPFIKFTLMLVIGFYSTNCCSQIEKPITKGNITLGGDIDVDLGFQNWSTTIDPFGTIDNKAREFSISINPIFGYFIYDGLVLGISPSYLYAYYNTISTYSFNEEVDENNSHSNSIGLNGFVKYYFKNSFFIGVESGYIYGISKYSSSMYPEDKYKFHRFLLSPSVGYAIFINSKISIEPSLNYKFCKSHSISQQEDSDEAPKHNLFFSVGFHLFL